MNYVVIFTKRMILEILLLDIKSTVPKKKKNTTKKGKEKSNKKDKKGKSFKTFVYKLVSH